MPQAKAVITRPANQTAYTGGDVVGGAFKLLPNLSNIPGAELLVTTVSLRIDIAAVPSGMTSFTLHCYKKTPPSAFADNAVWVLSAADRAEYLGAIPLGSPAVQGATSPVTLYVGADQINKHLKLDPTETTIYCYLVSNGGFTPGANSEVYNVEVYAAPF
jgi:hypothetical protein